MLNLFFFLILKFLFLYLQFYPEYPSTTVQTQIQDSVSTSFSLFNNSKPTTQTSLPPPFKATKDQIQTINAFDILINLYTHLGVPLTRYIFADNN